jgi:hypothetical protein
MTTFTMKKETQTSFRITTGRATLGWIRPTEDGNFRATAKYQGKTGVAVAATVKDAFTAVLNEVTTLETAESRAAARAAKNAANAKLNAEFAGLLNASGFTPEMMQTLLK